jgi:hypothetical protein
VTDEPEAADVAAARRLLDLDSRLREAREGRAGALC